jgi:hypothetical protein
VAERIACTDAGSVAKFDFWGKIQKFGIRNSMTYRLPKSRKNDFATEPLSMLTVVCHLKKVMHRAWPYFHARLAFTMAAFNVLVQWYGLRPNTSGFVPLSIAEFSL